MVTKCILIIEDEQDILTLYKELLKGAGFEVETAENGEDGLNKILEGKAQLVLLDIMMPKLDGIGILQTLKERGSILPKIVMLTNLSQDNVLKEAEELGAIGWIIKSEVTPDKLLEKINHILET